MVNAFISLIHIILLDIFRDPLIKVRSIKISSNKIKSPILDEVSYYFCVMRGISHKQPKAIIIRYPNASLKTLHAIFKSVVFIDRLAFLKCNLHTASLRILLTCFNNSLNESFIQSYNLKHSQILSVQH